MNKHSSLVIVLVCFLSVLYGQNNFKEGLYITNSGDTIRGYIESKGWDKNPEEITFKKTLTDESVSLSPSGIRQVSLQNLVFKSADVELERSPFLIDKLNTSPEFEIIKRKVFLQVLVEGSKNLYRYKDENNKVNFYIGIIDQPELLLYKKYVKKTGINNRYSNGDAIIESKKFIGQLINYFGNEMTEVQRIQSLEYTERSLLKYFLSYMIGTGKSIDFCYKQKNKKKLRFSLIAGAVQTNLDLSSSLKGLYFYEKLDLKPSFSFTPGFACDIPLSRNNEDWQFRSELLYNYYNVEGEFSENINDFEQHDFSAKLSYSYLKCNFLIKRNINFSWGKAYVNGGLNLSMLLNGDSPYTRINTIRDLPTTREGLIFEESYYNKHEEDAILGVGINLKNIGFETRITKSMGLSNDLSTAVSLTRVYYLIYYTF